MKTGLYDLICRSADRGITLQGEEGRLPGGHNGPWHNQDTHVRTTAHWALVFFSAYKHTYCSRYLDAATRACDYLASEKTRPPGLEDYSHRQGLGITVAARQLIDEGLRRNENEADALASLLEEAAHKLRNCHP